MGRIAESAPFFFGVPGDLTLVKLVVTARTSGAVSDPYALFRMRSAFERALLLVTGCRESDGSPCLKGNSCPCKTLLGQPLSPDPAALKRHQKPPLPFAFQFPLVPGSGAGALFEIGLTLVGTAVPLAPLCVSALELLLRGDAGPTGLVAAVERVESVGYFRERCLLLEEGESPEEWATPELLSAGAIRDTRILSPDRLCITYVTPLKLVQDGRPLTSFAFSPFFRTLMRRVTSLAATYGDGELEGDFRWLARQSETVQIAREGPRLVSWDSKGKLAGLLGEVELVGQLEEFLPILLMGEYLNTGKGAAFGLGQFSVH